MESKEREVINMYDDWIRMKQRNLSLQPYFEENKIENVAIYGMNKLGYTLLEELKLCGIMVKYGIDKTLAGKAFELPVKDLNEEWENIDAVIIAAFQYYDEVYSVIRAKLPHVKVIPLDIMIKRVLLEDER